jgi:hypothetical protein
MFLACKGLGPRLTPRRVHGEQCRIDFYATRSFSNANTGQPKSMQVLYLATLIKLRRPILEVPSSKTGKML